MTDRKQLFVPVPSDEIPSSIIMGDSPCPLPSEEIPSVMILDDLSCNVPRDEIPAVMILDDSLMEDQASVTHSVNEDHAASCSYVIPDDSNVDFNNHTPLKLMVYLLVKLQQH